MKATAASTPDARRIGRIRLVGIAVLVALAVLIGREATVASSLSAPLFDAYQAFSPRIVKSMPAVVVEIDEKSLKEVGHWPWPRNKMAELVEAIRREHPAAIALDIVMPEADALSPERLLVRGAKEDAALAAALAGRPSNDALLARALAAAKAIVVVAGMPEATGMPLRGPLVTVRDSGGTDAVTGPRSLNLTRYLGALTSIDALDRAAFSRGLISFDPEGGVVRRIPLAADVDGTLVPALAVEMLRVAIGASAIQLHVAGSKVEAISTGDFIAPTEADGTVRVYFSQRKPDRFVSAIDVLDGKVEPDRLAQKLVVIGLTGLGWLEYKNTPVGQRMPGSEIHAQLLENFYDGTLLRRPSWAPVIEMTLFLILGGWLIYVTPRWKAGNAALLMVAGVVACMGAAFLAFYSRRLLFDAATPSVGLILVFVVLLVLTLAEATRQRRMLERLVQLERERTARIAGELQAAERIQTGTLPRADLMAGDRRIDVAASMVPARETGGDLYDYFLLDDRRFFFLAGDVAGKGLSASIFMAVSKALYKSATLRAQNTDIGLLMSAANAEVSRDNPQMLFVTAFAGILDLETGELEYCNAGHENPFLFHPTDAQVRRIEDGDGPPLCAMSDIAYEGGLYAMRQDELLCVVTDGVTEAVNHAGEMYGSTRVLSILPRLAGANASAHDVVKALRADVHTFAAGADPADDLTILVLRWRGPGAAH